MSSTTTWDHGTFDVDHYGAEKTGMEVGDAGADTLIGGPGANMLNS